MKTYVILFTDGEKLQMQFENGESAEAFAENYAKQNDKNILMVSSHNN